MRERITEFKGIRKYIKLGKTGRISHRLSESLNYPRQQLTISATVLRGILIGRIRKSERPIKA